MNRTSKLFWPVVVTPKDAIVKSLEATSKSQRLMHELGLIKSSNNGTYHILPIAQRAIDKCINLVNKHMTEVGGQKVSLPVLTSSALWKKTGRLDQGVGEFFITKDRQGKDHLLSPTHEEAITSLMAMSSPISYKQLPLRLYQIGPKFRDELKPRFGLMRAKEFLMKDMYTFDRNVEDATATYHDVNAAYLSLFKKLEVHFVKVDACAGMMGGSMSHEYHFASSTGEDKLLKCTKCDYASNEEVAGEISKCPKCKADVEVTKGIEIAHTFLLKDKYSKPLKAQFLQANGKPENFCMGCYGIGVTRMVAAALEVLSTETELKWPTLLAPFDICIISPKEGSKERQAGLLAENELFQQISRIANVDDILLDDRSQLTIGKRFLDAKRMGYPIIIVIGSKISEQVPKVELHILGKKLELEPIDVLSEIQKFMEAKKMLSLLPPDEEVQNNDQRLVL